MTRIISGQTTPQDWRNYDDKGIEVTVNTSAAGFKTTPHYITTLHGTGFHWRAVGINAIYKPAPKQFKILLRWADSGREQPAGTNDSLTAEFAEKNGWFVEWTGIESD